MSLIEGVHTKGKESEIRKGGIFFLIIILVLQDNNIKGIRVVTRSSTIKKSTLNSATNSPFDYQNNKHESIFQLSIIKQMNMSHLLPSFFYEFQTYMNCKATKIERDKTQNTYPTSWVQA